MSSRLAVAGLCLATLPAVVAAQPPRALMPIELEHSAEFGWLAKPVLDSRVLDDMTDATTWSFQGTGRLTFPAEPRLGGMRVLRVDMDMFHDAPAPTRNRLSSINLRRLFPGDDWRAYNRISLWIRPDINGFPMLPLQLVLHNDGTEKVPDAYYREGIHYVTLLNDRWQQVVWEITPLARDRVTTIEIGYWVNKMLAGRGDRVGFEIGRLELQRVEPDHYEGWSVAPGKLAFSHTGYQLGSEKTALASDLQATEFRLVRLDGNVAPEVVFTGPVQRIDSRLGSFQRLDFSAVRTPGRYVLHAGDRITRPFRIQEDAWRGTILKVLNFIHAERCGFAVPGSHDVDHLDWFATHGDQRIVMNGGWHDAGDLSQGMVNTGEATYALFALAEQLQSSGGDAELLRTLLDEAKWGLDWVLRVRFADGYRIGFASHNLWTNGIVGDADDRAPDARNNPNVNYIAAAAAALAYRVLKDSDPQLAARSLRVAEDDWRHAITGIEGAETWSTPAYAATPLELAGSGVLASLELYDATRNEQYARKAIELAHTIIDAQQRTYIGREFPLAGFFYTAPDRQTIFHQFHRGNDQAPIVALTRLATTFPEHPDWMKWYAAVARYAEYQKTSARITEPYDVLPAYVYHERDTLEVAEQGALHMATRASFREQVRHGMRMGDGYYLRAFPVWFARRGNYGVLLAQAKALAAAAHLRRDWHAAELAQRQAQWIVGRNPFVQSTMYGEGYDWAQQYSVSSGDFVGSLPVGMQSRGTTDLPYWPSQNMYVYKEVWIHPASRWLWLMQDIAGPALIEGRVAPNATDTVELTELSSNRRTRIVPGADGTFRSFVAAGNYRVRNRAQYASITALPRSVHHADLRPGHALDYSVHATTLPNGTVTIELTARGDGTHTFTLRTDNLTVTRPSQTRTLRPAQPATIRWNGRMQSTDGPWVAVVIPDRNIERRRDLFGALPHVGRTPANR